METPALSITTYYCTIFSTCTFSTTKFEAWVSHELTFHPIDAHDVWLCHRTPSVPECTCNFAFILCTDFEKHWFKTHPKDEVDNWRLLKHEEYLLGPEGNRLFWCGFCKRVFSCHMTKSWKVDRFEHIAAHFDIWNATWDHFEFKKWRHLDFWVEQVVKIEPNADEDKKPNEKDGVEAGEHAKHSKGVKESKKAGKDTKGAKKN